MQIGEELMHTRRRPFFKSVMLLWLLLFWGSIGCAWYFWDWHYLLSTGVLLLALLVFMLWGD
jgi:hypothetical protein